MKKKNNRLLYILMNGKLVGKLVKHPTGTLSFSYEQAWLNQPGALPISLSLPLIDRPFEGDIVYNFLDNLLTDNDELRKRIQARFHTSTDQPFDLLACIGKDCVGAIQFAEDHIPVSTPQIKGKPLKEKEIADRLRNYQKYPLGMSDDIAEFRISIAGVQEKDAFLYNKGKWHIPLGGTPTTHIFKLPIGYIKQHRIDLSDSCENEWVCAQIAKAFGLEVAHCDIANFEEVKVLVVERFDRILSDDKSWILRLPQEDMCQALGIASSIKYQSDGGPGMKDIMRLLLSSSDPIKDREAFYRAQVLFWLLAAIDGHAKNFSLFLKPGGKYGLTPLYDIMSAYPLIAKKHLQKQKIKMAMALKGKSNHYEWYTIQRRHFNTAAQDAGFSTKRAEMILDEMLEQVNSVTAQVSSSIPQNIPENIYGPIFEGMAVMKDKLGKK